MAISLVLIRHAHAEIDSTSGADSDRSLSDLGQQQAKKLGELIQLFHVSEPGLVLTSGYLRAQQTLEILRKQGLTVPKLVESPVFAPEGNLKKGLQILKSQAVGLEMEGGDCVVLVGHNPFLKRLLSTLSESLSLLYPRFPKAALVWLRYASADKIGIEAPEVVAVFPKILSVGMKHEKTVK